jgi:uncharacterized membrane protein
LLALRHWRFTTRATLEHRSMALRHLLGAAAAGAVAMFMLDPREGSGRRARARAGATRGWSQLDSVLGTTARDVGSRTRGIMSEVRSRVAGGEVPDEQLGERVRSRLGRAVSHPDAIDVQVAGGKVILSGAVLEREYIRLLRTIWAVRGVIDVEDRLAVYESAEGIPALSQARTRGNGHAAPEPAWTPSARAIIGGVGCVLLAQALVRRRAVDLPFALAGTALLLRSTTNQPIGRLTGAQIPAVELDKSIDVLAPLEQVFEAFAHYENFPQFLPCVREIHVRGDGTARWTVLDSGGHPINWETLTTRLEPNRLISWRSLAGSDVDHAGFVRFEPRPDGGTRVLLTLSYTPPGGVLGQAVARLLGPDPGAELDQDLVRMKAFLERGRRTPETEGPRAAHH